MPFRTKKTKIYQYDIVVAGSRFRGTCGTEDYEDAKAVEAGIRAEAKQASVEGSIPSTRSKLSAIYVIVIK